ncbi:unnamed protein product [Gongylonema pulchrum]|uniref:Secreted protein n=1 Tax=Gongylonema pulchrum TaxID=637853 RepID=A0A183E0E8_9BILA|nr:unnamed protein product [Gongylonema pulchrum]
MQAAVTAVAALAAAAAAATAAATALTVAATVELAAVAASAADSYKPDHLFLATRRSLIDRSSNKCLLSSSTVLSRDLVICLIPFSVP